MRCVDFQELHCAFVDDTLAGVELVQMERHLIECSACAELDQKVRRSLMLVRSLPAIEPSANFSARLEERLRECRCEQTVGRSNFRAVAAIGAVTSAVMLGYVVTTLLQNDRPQDVVLPPVIALAEPPQQPSIASPAIVASVSAGIPFWPAAMFADQVPMHLVSYREGQ